MKILDNIELIKLALYLKKQKTLVLSDIHIGYEEALNKQGVLVPRIYFKHLYEKTKNLIKELDFNTLVINGDLKHEFGTISKTEWRHTVRFLDLFKDKKVFLIKGNHDTILGPIAEQKNLELVDYYIADDVIILHGDEELDISKINKAHRSKLKIHNSKIKTIIIGHEHPAISIKSENRAETFKCFLIGKTRDKKYNLIAMPSYNEITEGTNVLSEQLLSPYLRQNLDSFRAVVYGNELLDFGRIKDMKKKQ